MPDHNVSRSSVSENSKGKKTSANEKYFSVHYKFDGDFSPIETWLSENCTGKFEFNIDSSAKELGGMMNIVLKFEQKNDRTRFKNMILSGIPF